MDTRNVADQSSSVRNTWATLAVIVARSTWSSGDPVASPCSHRARSAPGLARATSSDAAAGSTPVTSMPWLAARAGEGSRHPAERPAGWAGPELARYRQVVIEIAAFAFHQVIDRRQPRLTEDGIHGTILHPSPG